MSVTLTKPTTLTLKPQNIPSELIDLDRWVGWKWEVAGNGSTKVPYQALNTMAHAASNRPSTWAAFADALWAYEQGKVDGIGFTITAEDDFVGGDLDHCIDPITQEVSAEARAIVERLPTYWEMSASGTGLHFFAHGTFEGTGRKENGRELYQEGRFFTVTGHALEETPGDVRALQEEITRLHQEWFPPKPPKNDRTPSWTADPGTCPLGDREILSLASSAKNSPKFNRLWTGDMSDYPDPTTGEPDESRAEGGLAGILAFYSTDSAQIERLMRQSGLARAKWDKHRTYLDRTIQGALNLVTDHYAPSIPVTPASAPTIPIHPETGSPDASGALTCIADLDQARARIAELERENARIPDLEATIARLNAERCLFMKVFTNPALKTLAPTVLTTAFEYASAKSRGMVDDDGYMRLAHTVLAEKAGVSTDTAARQTKELAARGFLDRKVTTKVVPVTDPATGRTSSELRSEQWVKIDAPLGDFLERLATYEHPEDSTKKWGGQRFCSEHPQARIVRRSYCEECGQKIGEDEFIKPPKIDVLPTLQDARPGEEPPEPHDNTTHDKRGLRPLSGMLPDRETPARPPVLQDARPVALSLILPFCPDCAVACDVLDPTPDDGGRGRFRCPGCQRDVWSDLRAKPAGRDMFDLLNRTNRGASGCT